MVQKTIRVCNGPNCSSKNAVGIMEKLSSFFGLKSGEKNDRIDLDYCRCLGFCSEAPNVAVDDTFVTNTNANTVTEDMETKAKKREDISAYKIDFDEDFLPL
jgi:NADH:ubiquinone oxidoreductase subunit E